MSFLVAWRHAVASAEGPSEAIDRHVALTLGLSFNSEGLSAWPSQKTLAIRTGLTERTVGRALTRLCRAHWLHRIARKPPRQPDGKPHKRWGYEYRAKLPKVLSDWYANGERRSVFTGASTSARNTESDAITIPNAVRTNTALERSRSLPIGRKELPTEGMSTIAAEEVRQRRAAREAWSNEYAAAEAQEAASREKAKAKRTPLLELARELRKSA